MTQNKDIDTLLDLDGIIIEQTGGYWTKFEGSGPRNLQKKFLMAFVIA